MFDPAASVTAFCIKFGALNSASGLIGELVQPTPVLKVVASDAGPVVNATVLGKKNESSKSILTFYCDKVLV